MQHVAHQLVPLPCASVAKSAKQSRWPERAFWSLREMAGEPAQIDYHNESDNDAGGDVADAEAPVMLGREAAPGSPGQQERADVAQAAHDPEHAGAGSPERDDTGNFERVGTGILERAGSGSPGRAGAGSPERAAAGSHEIGGAGRSDSSDAVRAETAPLVVATGVASPSSATPITPRRTALLASPMGSISSPPSGLMREQSIVISVKLAGSDRRKRLRVPHTWEEFIDQLSAKLKVSSKVVRLTDDEGAEIEELGELRDRDNVEVHTEESEQAAAAAAAAHAEAAATGRAAPAPASSAASEVPRAAPAGNDEHAPRQAGASGESHAGDVDSVASSQRTFNDDAAAASSAVVSSAATGAASIVTPDAELDAAVAELSSDEDVPEPHWAKASAVDQVPTVEESPPRNAAGAGGPAGRPPRTSRGSLHGSDWEGMDGAPSVTSPSPSTSGASSFVHSNLRRDSDRHKEFAAPLPAQIRWDDLDAREIVAQLQDLLEEEPADANAVLQGIRMFARRAAHGGGAELPGTVGVMLLAIRTFTEDAPIVGRAIAVLIGLTNTTTRDRAANKELIARAGGISALVDVMRLHPDNRVLQQDVTICLNNLAVKNLYNKSTIVVSGAVRYIVAAMEKYIHSTDMLEPACSALGTLGVGNAKNKELIVEQGGAQALIRAMVAHPHHARIQYCGAAALNNLALNNAEHKSLIVEEGGIQAITDAMRYHLGNASILFSCCSALKTLTMKNSAHKGIVVDSGAVRLMILARAAHRENPQVQKEAQLAMRSIAWWEYDEDCSVCPTCDAAFTLFTRQHHCRSCGRIFCNDCSDNYAPLPELGLYDKDDSVRLCRSCYKQVTDAAEEMES